MNNENKYRYSKVCVVVGERGTGKTTFLSDLIKSIGQKVIVCTPHIYE